jgi:hypothetical protein
MPCSLCKFSLASFWKLLVFDFLLGKSENLYLQCSSSKSLSASRASTANIAVGTMTYLKWKLFLWIIFSNGTFLIIEILIAFSMN